MSEYSIRNTDQTLNKNFLQLAAKLAKNTETQDGKSISDREVQQLLNQALNNDGTISEEEIKFIAGLKVEKNVSELKAANFEPKGKEIKFKDVTDSALNDVRKRAHQLSASYRRMSSVESAVKKNESLYPFFNSLNDWSKSYEARKDMVSKYKEAQGAAGEHYKTIADLDFFSSGILPLPNEAPGMKKYMIDEVQKNPMSSIMNDLCSQIKNGGLNNPQKVFDEALRLASKHKAKDPKRAALFAMAMLGNELHNGYFELKNEGLRLNLREAYIRFNNIDNKDGSRVVMSHNVVSKPNFQYGRLCCINKPQGVHRDVSWGYGKKSFVSRTKLA